MNIINLFKQALKNHCSVCRPFYYVIRDIFHFRVAIFIVAVPLLFLPLLTAVDTKQSRCLYVIIVMTLFWITEALPLPVTSLIPLFMFPLLGIIPAKKLASEYVQDPTFLFMGGFFLALAIEKSQFHRRVALGALLIVGSDIKWLLLSSMCTTGFLSMWMTNTATTAMMLPIVEAILTELIKDKRTRLPSAAHTNKIAITLDSNDNLSQQPAADSSKIFKLNPKDLSHDELNLCKMLFLSICYSANIGGISTLTGTGTNIIVANVIEKTYGTNTGLTYASWMGFAMPLAILNLLFAWFLLLTFFNGLKNSFSCSKKQTNNNVMNVIKNHYKSLGPMKFDEIIVLILFIALILLWIFRSPKFVFGWGDYFRPGYVSDATPAMFAAFLLFILPSEWPDFLCTKTRNKTEKPVLRESLLTWSQVQTKFPWGIVLLLGGSLSMASAIEESGLSKILGEALASLNYISPSGVCVIAAVIATFATEVCSNMALVSVLAPIVATVAEKFEVNPLYFLVTVTVCVSYAFMLPIATPANAIVFGYGFLRVVDMIKIGFFMNCVSIALTFLATHTWASAIFALDKYPDWAPRTNNTLQLNNSFVATFNQSFV